MHWEPSFGILSFLNLAFRYLSSSNYIKLFFIPFLTFSQTSFYFSSNSLSFIEKDIYLKYLLYTLTFEEKNAKRSNFFSIFVAKKIFKTLLPQKYFIKYYYIISIYIVYWNRALILVKFVFFDFSITKDYTFFSFLHIISVLEIFFLAYNFPLFCLYYNLK